MSQFWSHACSPPTPRLCPSVVIKQKPVPLVSTKSIRTASRRDGEVTRVVTWRELELVPIINFLHHKSFYSNQNDNMHTFILFCFVQCCQRTCSIAVVAKHRAVTMYDLAPETGCMMTKVATLTSLYKPSTDTPTTVSAAASWNFILLSSYYGTRWPSGTVPDLRQRGHGFESLSCQQLLWTNANSACHPSVVG